MLPEGRNEMKELLPRVGAIAVLLGTWHLLSQALQLAVLPGPAQAFRVFFQEMNGGLAGHFGVSTYRVLSAIAASLLAGVPLGLVLGREERLDRFFSPFIYLIYPIPKVVFLPLVMVLLGLGDLSKIFLITLVVFFQIFMTTRDAARGVNKEAIYSMQSLGAGRRQIYLHVIWPACLPKVLTALRIGSGTAIAVLFIAETWSSRAGLGYYLLNAWSSFLWDKVFAGIIAMGLLGFIIYITLDFLERKLCPWEYV